MKNRRTLLIVTATAILAVAATVSLLTNRDKTPANDSLLSSNIALLDNEQVPDYDLRTNDSLLHFEATVANLGRMKIGQTKEVAFDFSNTSANPVVITRVVTTCGCTSADYEKTPLMPGKTSTIKVGFEAEEEGVFFKKIFVYCAGESAPLEIAIKGEVR